ncbi:PQQ-dependent sugar dehydrogenase [Glycomyces tritici]|uniref:PQQ-dependent sugar dehydrogenase n=1 Tax=Glycomyces tritici TaxID=2665176 RepID=A0ABT7YHZ3_9ACTN|nr:PQQ-dependent sugar dehydrogenase [Glycomyces tritici]MDN3238243.1 PQQ-dependent sugar dehydrogenase [Glycomyces tritici]
MRRTVPLAAAAVLLCLTACAPAEEPDPVPALELVTDALAVPNDIADLGDGRLLISDQVGRISVLEDGEVLAVPFLDLTDAVSGPDRSPELGLSGFAPHPDFAENGRVLVYYTKDADADAPSGSGRTGVLAEFTLDAAGTALDRASERVLLRHHGINDHIGGHMAFDDQGLLYLGLGSPTFADLAQDPFDLHGKVIRIDVDGEAPYAIPADNPFADGAAGAPEVFTYGHRNPWRLHWDAEIGLLIPEPMWSDKAQEVNLAAPGANFGYPQDTVEGRCYDGEAAAPLPVCTEPFTPPAVEYGPGTGAICSGAVIYRGSELPQFEGKAIVADWAGTVIVAEPGEGRWSHEVLDLPFPDEAPLKGRLWSIDVDANGEVYLMTSELTPGGAGAVYRLTAA